MAHIEANSNESRDWYEMHDELGVVFTLKETLKSLKRLSLPPIVCNDGGVHALDEDLVAGIRRLVRRNSRLQEVDVGVRRGVRILSTHWPLEGGHDRMPTQEEWSGLGGLTISGHILAKWSCAWV
jgi:hypothetical protein